MARQAHIYSLVGTGYVDDQKRLHNSAALFAPDGTLADRYDKHWLVPMGEWVPMPAGCILGTFSTFPNRMSSQGATDANLKAATLICAC